MGTTGTMGSTGQKGTTGTPPSETKITADVKKNIMADKTLSATSKNVKVTTSGTKVTLKGTVKSDADKSTLESLARQTDGVTDVDNQITVKK
jgi:osmotically-inducible protein OsmY